MDVEIFNYCAMEMDNAQCICNATAASHCQSFHGWAETLFRRIMSALSEEGDSKRESHRAQPAKRSTRGVSTSLWKRETSAAVTNGKMIRGSPAARQPDSPPVRRRVSEGDGRANIGEHITRCHVFACSLARCNGERREREGSSFEVVGTVGVKYQFQIWSLL